MGRVPFRRLVSWVKSRPLVGFVIVTVLIGIFFGVFGGFSGDDGSVYVELNNSADTTRTFEVWFGRDPITDITVHRSTGGDYTTKTFPGGIGTTNASSYHTTTSLSFPANATLFGRYTLSPGDNRSFNVTEPYRRTVFVVVVYNADHVTVYKTIRCHLKRWGVGVRATDYGAPGTHYC